MFGFGKRKPAPPTLPGNPGIGVQAEVTFSNSGRSWTEKVDIVRLAASALLKFGHAVSNEKTWLLHKASGYSLLPQIAHVQPLDGAVHTTTTLQFHHPAICPEGAFEYQHSTGGSMAESIAGGFEQWAQFDFPALLDALRPTPQHSMMWEMEFPAAEGKPARRRRAVLGPVAHCMQAPRPSGGDEHPFCPCCLLTKSFEAFRQLMEADRFYGLRLFAARDADGTPQADCRVNGEDWEAGAAALRDYVATWPPAGFEFRKQYVVLHTIAAG